MALTISQIDEMIEKAKETYSKDLKQSEFIDPLTRIPNRRSLEKNTILYTLAMIKGKLLNIQERNTDATFSAIYCDITNLKTLNDKYRNHKFGDYAINKIVYIIQQHLRDTDFVYRLHEGGDEFVIILPRCTKEQAEIAKERITAAIEEEVGIVTDLSLAMGIVDTNNKELVIPENLNEKNLNAYFNKLINLADEEMVKEKHIMPNAVDENKKLALLGGPILRMYTILGLNPSNEEDRIVFNDYVDKATEYYLKGQDNIEKKKQEKKGL